MNTDDGALDFDVYFKNKDFNKAVDETEKRVKGFSSAVVAEGEKIDDMFRITTANINIQKDLIGRLENDVANLNIEITKLPKGSIAQEDMKKKVQTLTAELNAEKTALKHLESEVKKNEVVHKSFRTILRSLRDEATHLEKAILDGVAPPGAKERLRELQIQMGKVKDQMDDTAKQAQILANDERGFQGVISMISGFTGAMSAAQGAVGLFAGQNERLQQIMLRVQSLMAITIGLQQVSQTLNKDSYFSIVVLTKAKELLAAANLKVATTFGISTAAAQAFIATATLGLSVAITWIIVALSKWSSKAAETRKEMKAMNDSIVDNAYKSITVLRQLSTEWSMLGDNMKAKEKFIEDNTEKFKQLGWAVNDVNEAERVLSDPDTLTKFEKALIARAKALAAAEFAGQKYKEMFAKQLELETTSKTTTKTITDPETGLAMSTYEVNNKKYAKIEAEAKMLEKAGDNLIKMGNKFTAEEKKILTDIGVSTNAIVEGSIAALEASISKLQTKYKNAASDSERSNILKELNSQQALLDKMDKSKNKGNDLKDKEEKERNKALKEYDKSLKEQLEDANSVLEKLDILRKKREELAGDTSKLGKGKLDILTDADRNVAKEVKDQTEKLFENYATYLSRRIKLQEDYTNEMILLQKRLDDASTPEEKAIVKGIMDNRTAQFNKSMKGTGDADYDAMLKDYASFEQKKQLIIEEYDEKRKKAQEFGNEELVKSLNEAQAEALSSLAVDELVKSPDWTRLFENLDNISTKEIEKLIELIESQQANLGIALNPQDLKAVMDKLQEAKREIEQRNPFKAFVDGIKEYSKATDEESKKKSVKKIADGAASSLDLIGGTFDSVVQGLEKMGFKADETTQQVIDDIGGIIKGASTLAQGIATNDPLAIIKGSIEIIANGYDLIFGAKDRQFEKQIIKHKDAVKSLEKAYAELQRAVQKALGADTYRSQQQLIKNLEKQRQEYLAMIEAERSKKKADQGKIDEYTDAYKKAGQRIEDILKDITDDILQTTAKDFASQLGDAISEAFGKGEDAALAFGETVNNIMKNAILNQLKKNFLEKQLQGALDDLYSSMGYWEGDTFVFDGLTAEEQQKFKDRVAQIGQNFTSALDLYSDLFKGLNDDTDKALSGGVKGVSEETASVVAGQMNAMRINQIESLNVLRNQLASLNKIEANTAMQVSKLVEMINIMKSNQTDPLRGQGII